MGAIRDFRKIQIEKDHFCPVCSKRFTVWDHSVWAYKSYAENGKKDVYICSYKCKRIFDAEREKTKKWKKAY